MIKGQKLPGTPDPMHMWPGARGINIAADCWGDPQGPLVLLQHGGGQTRHAWKRAGEFLGDVGYLAAAFDARGHGDSDWAPDGVYGPDVMVEDLLGVIAHLGRQSAALVGASMGGVTSLIAAGEGKVGALALVLVDIAPRIEIPGLRKIQNFMAQKPEGFDSLEEVAQAIASYQPHRSARQVSESVAKNVRLGANGKYHWHWDPRYRASGLTPEKRLGACRT